jgi:hypothetical protein
VRACALTSFENQVLAAKIVNGVVALVTTTIIHFFQIPDLTSDDDDWDDSFPVQQSLRLPDPLREASIGSCAFYWRDVNEKRERLGADFLVTAYTKKGSLHGIGIHVRKGNPEGHG